MLTERPASAPDAPPPAPATASPRDPRNTLKRPGVPELDDNQPRVPVPDDAREIDTGTGEKPHVFSDQVHDHGRLSPAADLTAQPYPAPAGAGPGPAPGFPIASIDTGPLPVGAKAEDLPPPRARLGTAIAHLHAQARHNAPITPGVIAELEAVHASMEGKKAPHDDAKTKDEAKKAQAKYDALDEPNPETGETPRQSREMGWPMETHNPDHEARFAEDYPVESDERRTRVGPE